VCRFNIAKNRRFLLTGLTHARASQMPNFLKRFGPKFQSRAEFSGSHGVLQALDCQM
jgi:hypothetical protein